MNTPFARLGIDSISMLTIRNAQAETLAGKGLDQDQWDDIDTPADLARALGEVLPQLRSDRCPAHSPASGGLYLLNMPQMAVGGLSESTGCSSELRRYPLDRWLAKALGQPTRLLERQRRRSHLCDLHPHPIAIILLALGLYEENERIDIDSRHVRVTARDFSFSEAMVNGATGYRSRLRLMSSFSKFGATWIEHVAVQRAA